MKRTSKILFFAILLVLQLNFSACYISTKAVNRSYYTVDNLRGAPTANQFCLVALDSLPVNSYYIGFESGTVCLIIYGFNRYNWVIKDEFPSLRVPFDKESHWNYIDLAKSNWKDKRTVLKQDDSRIQDYQKAIDKKPLSCVGTIMVLDLKQIYENIENCFGVVLIGKKRCYYFHNSYNLKTNSYGILYHAFYPGIFDSYHTILATSNDLKDIKKAAKSFAEKHDVDAHSKINPSIKYD